MDINLTSKYRNKVGTHSLYYFDGRQRLMFKLRNEIP